MVGRPIRYKVDHVCRTPPRSRCVPALDHQGSLGALYLLPRADRCVKVYPFVSLWTSQAKLIPASIGTGMSFFLTPVTVDLNIVASQSAKGITTPHVFGAFSAYSKPLAQKMSGVA